jgi:hypothetical protein
VASASGRIHQKEDALGAGRPSKNAADATVAAIASRIALRFTRASVRF